MKKCPYCAVDLEDNALECRRCGEYVVPPTPLSDVLTENFIRAHTQFQTLQEMLDASGNLAGTYGQAWSDFIVANSDFGSWLDMYAVAGTEYLRRQLGF